MEGYMNTSHETAKEAARRLSAPILDKGFKPVALHAYTDAGGSPAYYRIRCKHPYTKEKWIRPMKLNGSGYEMGEPKFPNGKPLYALHQLISNLDAVVYIVEGEQKADALNKLGLVSTTSGGATSADTTDWEPLKSRTVRIFPDNDDAGKAYAGIVASILLSMGCTVSCVDVDKLGLDTGDDVMEWLVAHPGASAVDIEALPILATDNAVQSDYIRVILPPDPLPSLPDVLQFDYSYLPDAFRGYVQDISERMQCPPDFAAVGVFIMMAAVIGRKVSIRPKRKDDWTVVPNLWGAVVGNSGTMKSPTLGEALSPIRKLSAIAVKEYAEAKTLCDARIELAKIQKEVRKSQVMKALKKDKSADVLDLLQANEAEALPILKRYITNNASYEALGELLIENPNGLLVEADEIIGLLKQLDAGGQEVARSFYLTAADGDKGYTFDRIMRGKGLHIDAVCLSIVGCIQPGVLAEYVRQATGGGAGADGLLQRFSLMVYPDISPKCHYVDRYPNSPLREAVNLLSKKLDELNAIEIGAEIDPYGGISFLRFDDAAQALFSEWIVKLDTRLRSGEEHPAILSHLSKYRKLVPSLALINHLCDTGHGAVSEAALLRAIAFSEYLESHAKRIYSYATRPDVDAAKTLLKRLANGKLSETFKARDIYQKGWAGLETPIKAQSAIDLLVDYRHLSAVEINTGGRPTINYQWIKVAA
ncbi:MAG: DUF3987 domain-containing protein [Nitrosomonadales bacterium]|nr:MAG: DUF3987 domain-containing protein [Nitrosomonadales bacterium]